MPHHPTIRTGVLALCLVLALCAVLAPAAHAAVADTTLENLISISDFIVIGKDVGVVKVKGVDIGVFRIEETLKGDPASTIYYLGRGTWMCDSTKVVPGERALLFFSRYQFVNPTPPGDEGDEGDEAGEEGIGVDRIPELGGYFNEPKGFDRALKARLGPEPFLKIQWSGYGRMPLRTVEEIEYASVWSGAVRIPAGIPRIPPPKGDFEPILRLDDLLDYIRALVDVMESRAQPR